jgi:hypothetical protein
MEKPDFEPKFELNDATLNHLILNGCAVARSGSPAPPPAMMAAALAGRPSPGGNGTRGEASVGAAQRRTSQGTGRA